MALVTELSIRRGSEPRTGSGTFTAVASRQGAGPVAHESTVGIRSNEMCRRLDRHVGNRQVGRRQSTMKPEPEDTFSSSLFDLIPGLWVLESVTALWRFHWIWKDLYGFVAYQPLKTWALWVLWGQKKLSQFTVHYGKHISDWTPTAQAM